MTYQSELCLHSDNLCEWPIPGAANKFYDFIAMGGGGGSKYLVKFKRNTTLVERADDHRNRNRK